MNEELIIKTAIELAKVVSEEMYEENDDSNIMGMGEQHTIEVEGLKYNVDITAFWESSNHFECSIKGVDNDFKAFKRQDW